MDEKELRKKIERNLEILARDIPTMIVAPPLELYETHDLLMDAHKSGIEVNNLTNRYNSINIAYQQAQYAFMVAAAGAC